MNRGERLVLAARGAIISAEVLRLQLDAVIESYYRAEWETFDIFLDCTSTSVKDIVDDFKTMREMVKQSARKTTA